jgi:hypothetical protein
MRTVFPDSVEDELKDEFFAKSPAGFFVEVGANEPRHGSQTWQFEQAGWNGVLVEPQPSSLSGCGRCGAPELSRRRARATSE